MLLLFQASYNSVDKSDKIDISLLLTVCLLFMDKDFQHKHSTGTLSTVTNVSAIKDEEMTLPTVHNVSVIKAEERFSTPKLSKCVLSFFSRKQMGKRTVFLQY